MKYYGKSEKVLKDMLAMFESGQVPKALARVFINRKDGVPCRAWSWTNQMLTAFHGHDDARGYRQWQEVGRHVKKGQKSFCILGPCFAKKKGKDDKGNEKDEQFLVGFRCIPVFGYSQTEGADLVKDQEAERWIENLPLIEVARSWGLDVLTYNGGPTVKRGWVSILTVPRPATLFCDQEETSPNARPNYPGDHGPQDPFDA